MTPKSDSVRSEQARRSSLRLQREQRYRRDDEILRELVAMHMWAGDGSATSGSPP